MATEKKLLTKKRKVRKEPEILGFAYMPRGAVEYHMSQVAIDDLLKNRKGADAKMNPQKFLCKYVNEQMGLLYNCVKVVGM